ncbi:hypothetical protein B0H10DRAFT_480237 [Mycena sp. CBHHK59/15]|nr:hypothetical protein B0H10DRAFT_480237 [Mycena sp. CBHHK59/15]
MAMESDCVSLQTSLTSSDTTDSSLLATPELTPPSSTSSHDGSETSFFSALSSNNSDTLKPDVGLEHASLVDSRISEMGLPERVQFPLAKLASLNPRKPPPLPLHGPVILHCSPDLRRPRKLRKSRPPVPRLSIDSAFSCVSGPLQSASSPTPLNHHQKTPLTSPIIPCRPSTPEGNLMRRNRRSSLPTIPSATFYSTSKWNGDEPDEGYVNSRMVRFQSPVGVRFDLFGIEIYVLMLCLVETQTDARTRSPRSPHPKALTRNASTHALVSLAWTGQVPSSIGSSGLSSIGSSFALPTPGGRSGL